MPRRQVLSFLLSLLSLLSLLGLLGLLSLLLSLLALLVKRMNSAEDLFGLSNHSTSASNCSTRLFTSQFTCFTGTNVQILTLFGLTNHRQQRFQLLGTRFRSGGSD